MDIIILSIATACISFTITETKLFNNFRNYVIARSSFFGELVSCGYCLGFWISLAMVIWYKPLLMISSFIVFDYFISILVIAWLSAFQWLFINYLFIKIGK